MARALCMVVVALAVGVVSGEVAGQGVTSSTSGTQNNQSLSGCFSEGLSWCGNDCPARCELEVEYRADVMRILDASVSFEASLSLVNRRAPGDETEGGTLSSWQLSWAFEPGETIARGEDGGWMSALRGDTAVLISPGGPGGQPARVVNAFGAGMIPAGGGQRNFSFTGIRETKTDPEPVRSVRLNGVVCEAMDASTMETTEDQGNQCPAPASRHWRYCCGVLLSSPPPSPSPQPANPPLPTSPSSPPPVNRSEVIVLRAPPTSPPSLNPDLSERAVWYERLESILAVGAFAIVGCCATALAKCQGAGQTSEDDDSRSGRVEAGSSHRKRTLLLPGQTPATLFVDQNGSVVRGAGTSTRTVANARVGALSVGEDDDGGDMTAGPMTFPGSGASSLLALSSKLLPDELHEIKLKDVCLGEMLGQGAYGTVHRGEWKKDEKDTAVLVAVKTLHAMTCVSRQEMRAFTREVAVLSRLDHKGIVRLLGACLRLPHVCIVEELMQGGSLWGFIHGDGSCRVGRRLTYEETLRVARDVAGAMAFLSTKGIIHRDLKSQNVLLTSRAWTSEWRGGDNEPTWAKVADFGIAKACGQTLMTTVGATQKNAGGQGTPAYMAPELFRGLPDAGMDETCDAYSYGVMLWECVTGRVPWEWMANHLQVIFAVAVEGSRLPLPDASESCGVTEELRDLVLECWKEEPDSRPRFKDVVQRVEAMRRHLGRL